MSGGKEQPADGEGFVLKDKVVVSNDEREYLRTNSWLVRKISNLGDNEQSQRYSYEVLFPVRPATGQLESGGSFEIRSCSFQSTTELLLSPGSLVERIETIKQAWDTYTLGLGENDEELPKKLFQYSKIMHALGNYSSNLDLGLVKSLLYQGEASSTGVSYRIISGLNRLESTSVILNFIERFFGNPTANKGNSPQMITIQDTCTFLEAVGKAAFPANEEGAKFRIKLADDVSNYQLPAGLALDILDTLSNAKNHGRATEVTLQIDSIVGTEGDSIQILIEDNGKGISPKIKLSELATQGVSTLIADSEPAGGLPLNGNGTFFLAKEVTRLNGGVGVKTSTEGTTFSIRIPCMSLDALAQGKSPNPIESRNLSAMQESIANKLTSEGYTLLKPIAYTSRATLEI